MGVALVEERVFEHAIGVAERLLDVAERQRHELVHVTRVAVLVNPRFGVRQAVGGPAERAQRLVHDIDEIERLERGQLVACNHGGDGVAHKTHTLDGERVFVLADRQNPVRDWKILAGEDQVHARVGTCPGGVDAGDAGVRRRGAEELTVHHPRQHDVVGKLRLPGDFRTAVHATARRADDSGLRQAHRADSWAIAASTASKIC